jgi:hypothetical protein
MRFVDPEQDIKSKQVPKEETKDLIDYFPINDIPSRHFFYHNSTKILGRRMNVSEVKKAAHLNSDNFDFIINSILSSAISGVDIGDIKVGDKFYLMLWLRANTFRDNSFKVDYNCPLCLNELDKKLKADKDYKPTEKELETSRFHFDLSQLKINYLPEDFNRRKKYGDLEIEIDYESVSMEEYKNTLIKDDPQLDKEILEVAANIGRINGKEYMLTEKYHILSNEMDPEHYVELEEYINKNKFGIADTMIVTCNKCGGKPPIGVTFCREFMLPKIGLS